VRRGEIWEDPTFPKGKYALFTNHNAPMKSHKESKKRWVKGFKWMRASEYFGGDDKFKVIDGVDPDDVVMGSCNNCYAFAAMSGLAEARCDEMHMGEKDRG